MNFNPGNPLGQSPRTLAHSAHQDNDPLDKMILSGTVSEAGGLLEVPALTQILLKELQLELKTSERKASPQAIAASVWPEQKLSLETKDPSKVTPSQETVINRIALEVERICTKSDRIQSSGQVRSWQLALARHRLQKCLAYYQLGSRKGRVELHGNLSAIVYRYVAPLRSQLSFQGRYNLIEDFLQGFYIESLKACRRENQLPEDYSPRTRWELAEYMAFTEQYARRRITLPGRQNQQLIVLRAQSFARRQPPEAVLDIELAMESAKGEDAEMHSRSPAMQ
ncbi:MAG: hypothetical protein VKJ46_07510, partial [Leptolyngbyaceae bacterium]|nr:hypothetical protein [Leptolyngbyaceae bacterium]